jgi:hypothetical protein
LYFLVGVGTRTRWPMIVCRLDLRLVIVYVRQICEGDSDTIDARGQSIGHGKTTEQGRVTGREIRSRFSSVKHGLP